MTPTAAVLPVPVASPEVLAFAAEKGVTEYLPAVLELARRVFPTVPLTVHLEEDPEIEDWCHIMIDAYIDGLEVEELVAAESQFTEGLFQVCPSTHVLVFGLGMR